MINKLSEWALNVLEVYSLNNRSLPYTYWYDFLLKKLNEVEGDILEFGVYRARTLSTTAFCASLAKNPRKVFGYDTFTGFPATLNSFDHPDNFETMYQNGSISSEHYAMIKQNKSLLEVVGRNTSTALSSTSGNFSSTSLDFVTQKINYLGLTNVELIQGTISNSIDLGRFPNKISAIFLDADLYDPYQSVLNNCWESLSPGGIVWLDEYFSLKFPGPRIAVDQFLSTVDDASLICIEAPFGEFQRWIIRKRGQ